MSEEILLEIIENELPDKNVEEFEDVSGLNKETYSVEFENYEDLIVTWSDKPSKIEDFKIEAYIISIIDEETGIAVPNILTKDLSGENLPPYLIMQKIDGFNPDDRFKYMPEDVKKDILRETGKNLAELHSSTDFENTGNFYIDEDGLKLNEKEVWSETLIESIGRHISGLENTFFEDLIEEVEKTFENHRSLIDEIEFEPVLLHEDFRPGNLIVKNNEIEAVIDWERALVGHDEYDLFKAERDFIDLKFRTEKTREKYRKYILEGYKTNRNLEDGWKKRREFYRFVHIIQDLYVFSDNYKDLIDSQEKAEGIASSLKEKLRSQIRTLEDIK